MKRFSIILMLLAFALTGCAGIQIDWGDTSEKGAKLVGCLVADNNPDWTERIVKYCDLLMSEGEPVEFQYLIEEGVDWLLQQYVEKPAIRMMIVDLLPEIQLAGDIPTPEWMAKVKPMVLNFREGVRQCGQPVVSTSFIQDYANIYETNYLKFLWGRTLD